MPDSLPDMDDPAFMLLQLQENLQFMRTQFGAHVLSCVTHDSAGERYWTYVLLTYDNHGNVQEYHEPFEGRAEWTNQPLEALKQLHLRVSGIVTSRLVHDCHPHLRTLAQQRDDEEVEHNSSSAADYPNKALLSTLRFTSERLTSDPPSYQTQDQYPQYQRPARPSHETLSSGTRTGLRKMQGFEQGRTIQPHQIGPAQFPQPSPALGPEIWSSRDTNLQVFRHATVESSANDGSNSREDETLPQPDRVRSTQTQSRSAGPNVRSSAFEMTNSARQTHVAASTLSLHPEAQPHFVIRSTRSSIPTQADNASGASRSGLPRSATNANLTPPWLSNRRGLHVLPSSNIRPPVTTSPVPEPLRSHPPPSSRDPIMIMMDQDTLTEFEEFKRRSNTQQPRNNDTLARIEQEAAEYLNQDAATALMVDDTFTSLAARLRNHGVRSPESDLPSSPTSDETVTAFNPPHHRRRMTQTRYRGNQTEDPLPPAAPSPPLNTYYPPNVPVYPPSLLTSRPEASLQQRAPNTRDHKVSSNNASTSRNVSFGREGSVASVVRKGPMEAHINISSSSEKDELSGERSGGKGIRRGSAQLQQSKGEQVRLTDHPLHLPSRPPYPLLSFDLLAHPIGPALRTTFAFITHRNSIRKNQS